MEIYTFVVILINKLKCFKIMHKTLCICYYNVVRLLQTFLIEFNEFLVINFFQIISSFDFIMKILTYL